MSKTILITGCSSGLGKLAALHFVAKGWNVVATMRTPDPDLAATCPDTMLVVPLDVADPLSIKAALEASVRRFGGLDAVINNAGVSAVSIFESMPDDAMRRIFETNVFGVINVIQASVPYLRTQGAGTIVNISSGVGMVSMPLLSIYTASKHAVEGLSESLAYELESQNIRVKLIEPGAVLTTNFMPNTLAASQAAVLLESYKSYYDYMLGSMMNYPFAPTDEQLVVRTIYRAVSDQSDRLRFQVGPDVEEYARLRWSTSEDHYRAEMSRLLGHSAWRDAAKAKFALDDSEQ